MKLPKELITITPLSRYLSLFVLTALPFIGFYVGFRYAERFTEYIESRANVDQYLLKNRPSATQDPSTANPDSIGANWKTYTNSKYGYQVKYPSAWIAKESNLMTVRFSSPDTNEFDHAGEVSIIIDEEDSIVNTEKEADEAFQKMNELLKTQSETEDTYKLEKKITVGDLLAFKTTGGCCLDVGRHVFIFKETNIYRITLYGPLTNLPLKNQEIFNQILSTFKFTE